MKKSKQNQKQKPKRRNQPKKKQNNNRALVLSRRGAIKQVVPIASMETMINARPKIRSLKNGSTCISHKEFIGNIFSTAPTFTVALFQPINPGLSTLFPWLAQIAANFETYKFRKLRFHYLTRAPTTTPGSIYIAIDYDPADPAPVNEQQLSTYEGCQNFAVWTESRLFIADEKALFSIGPKKFVRTGALIGVETPQAYDVGSLIIATSDSSGSFPQSWGKLWVEYECEFYTPQQNPSAANQNSGAISGTAVAFGSNISIFEAPNVSFGNILMQKTATNTIQASNLVPGVRYITTLNVPLNVGGTTALTISVGNLVGMQGTNTLLILNDVTAPGGVCYTFSFTATNSVVSMFWNLGFTGTAPTQGAISSVQYIWSVNGINF
jgi:hypothetical protein